MGLRVSHTLSCFDPLLQMGRFTYTKADIELIMLKQLENLDALGERVRLLQKQNELLMKMNHKLMEELSEERKEIKPYPKASNRRPKQ